MILGWIQEWWRTSRQLYTNINEYRQQTRCPHHENRMPGFDRHTQQLYCTDHHCPWTHRIPDSVLERGI